MVGPGVYYGNQNFLGNYDECVNEAKASYKTYIINVGGRLVSHEHTTHGKYCRVYWLLGDVSTFLPLVQIAWYDTINEDILF